MFEFLRRRPFSRERKWEENFEYFDPRGVFDRAGPVYRVVYVCLIMIVIGLAFSFLNVLALVGGFFILICLMHFVFWLMASVR